MQYYTPKGDADENEVDGIEVDDNLDEVEGLEKE